LTTLLIEYWPPLRVIGLPPNVHARVGSVDETVVNLMIIFLDAGSTVTLGSSDKLGFTVALAPAAAAVVVVVVVSAAAALRDVTATTTGYLMHAYSLAFAGIRAYSRKDGQAEHLTYFPVEGVRRWGSTLVGTCAVCRLSRGIDNANNALLS